MSKRRVYELHGPYCPDDCLTRTDAEEILEIFDFVTQEQLDAMVIGKYIEVGPDGDYRIYRKKDATTKVAKTEVPDGS